MALAMHYVISEITFPVLSDWGIPVLGWGDRMHMSVVVVV